VTSCNCTW